MDKVFNSIWLKIFLLVCFLFMASSLYYLHFVLSDSFNFSNSSVKQEAKSKNFVNNMSSLSQENLLDSLNVLKLMYDKMLVEKTVMSDELELERKNVQNLMEIINVAKTPSVSEMKVYRKQFSDLKVSYNSKINEIETLKFQNKKLLNQLEDQNVVMYQQKSQNDTLLNNQKQLETTLKTASKLMLTNIKVVALKEKSNGLEVQTDKASKASKLKISFLIQGNQVAKTGKKMYYVQVLDQNNSVLGENKLADFGNNSALVYSFLMGIDFQGKAVPVYGILNSAKDNFDKGTYFVNVFDKKKLVGSAGITLN